MSGFDTSRKTVAEGARHLALGVGSDFRLGIAPTPLVFDHAAGAYLVDVDGNRYVDYYLGMGPMILGHTPAPVVEAAERAMRRGLLFGGQSDLEYEAAARVCALVPCADLVRFTSSGSEAVQTALRIARFATGRTTVLKFEGHYHGWFDNVLWSASPALDAVGDRTQPSLVPGSRGMDPACGTGLAVLPWNDADLAVARIEQGDLAAVIMEPAMCNTSAVLPRPGYLEAVREACTRTGTVLVFDEVITGFRVAPGGAQSVLGVTPDLATFGKALAAGFPVAAVAGRQDLMEQVGGPAKAVHAGTYNGGLPAMAATVAALDVLARPETTALLERQGSRLRDGISAALSSAGVTARVAGFPQVFHVALGVGQDDVVDYRTAQAADKARYGGLVVDLLDRGVRALERGAWFVSTEHDDQAVDQTLSAVQEAVSRLG